MLSHLVCWWFLQLFVVQGGGIELKIADCHQNIFQGKTLFSIPCIAYPCTRHWKRFPSYSTAHLDYGKLNELCKTALLHIQVQRKSKEALTAQQ